MKHCLRPIAVLLAACIATTATHGRDSATPHSPSLYTRLHRAAAASGQRRLPGDAAELPRRVYPTLDLAVEALGVEALHEGYAPDMIPFTGKGVTIAVIDAGIDPRHEAFRLAGEPVATRVASYMRTISSAESESGETEYTVTTAPLHLEEHEIDLDIEGHGTHVAGIAAGNGGAGPYTGMAPGAELFMVSMGERLYDDEIALGMRAALDYADATGRPMVLNFSLGSPLGPHKGTDKLTGILRDYPAEGRIACFSAGNDGCYHVSLTRDFASRPGELATALAHYNTGTATRSAYVEAYSMDSREFEMALTVIDFNGSVHEVWRSEFVPADAFDESGVSVLLDSAAAFFPELAGYFSGKILMARGTEDDGAFSMALLADFPDAEVDSRYGLGLVVRSAAGADVMLVSDFNQAYFRSYSMDGYTEGDAGCSISEYCTSPLVVSVGSWNTRKSWTDLKGDVHELDEQFYGACGAVASYSSYGTVRGDESIVLPHVLAPGTEVISSIPAMYADNAVYTHDMAGNPQYWGNMSGTSMASPAVAGVVALWLEACPRLTRDDVIEVMRATSVRDEYVERAPNGSAFGKLDAYEGLKYILQTMDVPLTPSTPSGLLVRSCGSGMLECVLPFSAEGGVAHLYTTEGILLESKRFSGSAFFITAAPGLYIVRAETASGEARSRVAVR